MLLIRVNAGLFLRATRLQWMRLQLSGRLAKIAILSILLAWLNVTEVGTINTFHEQSD